MADGVAVTTRLVEVPAGYRFQRDRSFTFRCPRCPRGVVQVGTGTPLAAGEDEMLVAMCAHAAWVHGEPSPFVVDSHDRDGRPVEVIVTVGPPDA